MSSKPPKSVRIDIPKPCTEDWNKMTPEAQGRHCASCSKIVTDFTTMSDSELIRYLAAGQGSGCGRVRPDQLDRVIVHPVEQHLWKFPKFVFARTLSLFTAIASSLATLDSAANTPKVETEIVHGGMRIDYPFEHVYVVGNVQCHGARIPGVKVSVPALGVDTVTDDSGHFELRIPARSGWHSEYIVFEHAAYFTKSVQLLGANYPLEIEIESAVCEITEFAPEPLYYISGGITAVTGVMVSEEASWTRRQWRKVKRVFSFRRFRKWD